MTSLYGQSLPSPNLPIVVFFFHEGLNGVPPVCCRLKFISLSVRILDLCRLPVNLSYLFVASQYFFPRFVGSQLYFSPFVASRLTPFTPSFAVLFCMRYILYPPKFSSTSRGFLLAKLLYSCNLKYKIY